MAGKSGKKFRLVKNRPVDFSIILLTTILVIFGTVMIFSASYYVSLNETGSPFHYLKRQIVWVAMGAVLMFICARLDYHFWKRLSIPILILSLGLLVLVIAGFGRSAYGATRWIAVGPITIMPGEIAKFALICFIANFLASDSRRPKSFFRGILPMFLLTAVFAFLIIKQPNLSTALTVCGIAIGMLFLAGMSWKYIAGLFGLGVAGLVVISRTGTYWADRILSFTDPFKDPLGDGFQVVQSLLALGTGGVTGLGLGKSVQKNLYLPMPQNDFILAIVGEELGLVGILLLMVLFLLLIWRCFTVAMKAPDRFGMLMAGGITMMIGLQVIMNVAIVTSSMPPTGVAMPFISYGGNALWICMASMGIILNISRHTKEIGAAVKPSTENLRSQARAEGR